MLLVFAVAVVFARLSEGSNVTRCELKSQLNASDIPLPQVKLTGLTPMDLVARLVCHVEKSTGFNASTVTVMTFEMDENTPKRGRRGAEGRGGPDEGMGAPSGGHNGPAGGHNGPVGGHMNPAGGYNGSAAGHNDHAGGHNGSTVTKTPRHHGNPPRRGRRGAEGREGSKGGMGAPAGGHDGPAGGHMNPAGGNNGSAVGHNIPAGGHHGHPGGHNGSTVTEMPEHHGSPPKRGRRGAEGKGGKKGGAGAPAGGNNGKKSSESSEEEEEKRVVWRLYGLFQLSDHVICSDGVTPSANICNMRCTDLLDDDLTDDVACLETIKAHLLTSPGKDNKDLLRMVNLLNARECVNVKASDYFAGC